MEEQKWYKEKTFRFAMVLIAILGVALQVGIWLVDGHISDWSPAIFFGAMLVLLPIMRWLLRNNP